MWPKLRRHYKRIIRMKLVLIVRLLILVACSYGVLAANLRRAISTRTTEYYNLLKFKEIWPVDPDKEQNWSGRGEHVEFGKDERKHVDAILQVEELLGSTNTAIVQSVRCRRILLARKTVRCSRKVTPSMVMDEVAHLNRLRHAHIVRVIGSYTIGQEFSILIYPVAQYNLEIFMQEMLEDPSFTKERRQEILPYFFGCLSSALAYIHEQLFKHNDIKPKNILVRERKFTEDNSCSVHKDIGYTVYIADFGIARQYQSLEGSETDGPTSFTRKYAAPEVVDWQLRGQPADIFSLGCVMIEMVATMAGCADENRGIREFAGQDRLDLTKNDELLLVLGRILKANKDGDASYQANIQAMHTVLDVIDDRFFLKAVRGWHYVTFTYSAQIIREMTDIKPSARPTARWLVKTWASHRCCGTGPCVLEA